MQSIMQELNELKEWDYYKRKEEDKLSGILDWNNTEQHREFIENFLKISGKMSVLNHFDFALESFERAIHTNSVFFLGCLFYNKLNLKDKISFIRKDGREDEFHFIWFLTSLVHDFGYFVENNKEKPTEVTRDIQTIKRNIDLLAYKNDTSYLQEAYQQFSNEAKIIIDNIPRYHKKAFCGLASSCRGKSKIDHGIFAGIKLYDALVKNRAERKNQEQNENDGLYWEEDLNKFYAIASFSIAIHNIRRGLIKDERVVDLRFSIDSEPFLVLFALADTIEPTKTFDCVEADYVLKNLLIGFQDNNTIIIKNASNSKLDFSKLKKKVQDLENWLDVTVDISNMNLMKITLNINNKGKQ